MPVCYGFSVMTQVIKRTSRKMWKWSKFIGPLVRTPILQKRSKIQECTIKNFTAYEIWHSKCSLWLCTDMKAIASIIITNQWSGYMTTMSKPSLRYTWDEKLFRICDGNMVPNYIQQWTNNEQIWLFITYVGRNWPLKTLPRNQVVANGLLEFQR